MNCRRIHRFLSAYHDGELSPAREQAVRGHLDHCAACRDRLRALQGVRLSLAVLDTPPPPAGLAERILRAAEERPAPSRRPAPSPFRPAWQLRIAGAAAAILCALAGAWVGGRLAAEPVGSPVSPPVQQLSGADPLQPLYSEPFRLLPSGSPGTEYLILLEEGGR